MATRTPTSSFFPPADVEILTPTELLTQFPEINVAAPMVRYSKLPFRELVSQYNVHITHTPMMLAQEFSRSSIARASDFTTSPTERGTFTFPNGRRVRGALIAQFASSTPDHLADAAELIHPYVDGIDLNCGCPQKWAYEEGIGSALLRKPDLVRDMVRAVRSRLGNAYTVSVKIRIDPEPARTVQLVQTAIQAGASYITIHGRTRHQASTVPVNLPGIAFARDAACGEVPCVANGDAWSAEEVRKTREETGCGGVMSARGLMANPALFARYTSTPPEAVDEFVRLSTAYGLAYPLFQRHIAYFLEDRLTKAERGWYNALVSHAGVLDWLEERGYRRRGVLA